MYSKAAENEDKNLIERWHKDADGILIFVSPHSLIGIYIVLCITGHCRLVYSLPPLLHFLP